MNPRRWILFAFGASVACTADRPPASDTPAAADPTEIVEPSRKGEWAPALGSLLVVPSDSATALVVYPDDPAADAVRGTPLTLLGAGGDTVVAAAVLALDDTLQCGDAPVAHLPPRTPGGWSVGFHGGATVIRSDSIGGFSARDSARVVADLARLASTLTGQAQSRFTGLPFAVLGARRFRASGSEILAAHLVRRLPQEADPLEEHTFIIAERTSADAWSVKFSRQSQGSEETAQYFDVIGIAKAADVTLVLLARDATAGTEYEILERSPAGAWRVRWTRPVGC